MLSWGYFSPLFSRQIMKHPDQKVKVPDNQLRNGFDIYQLRKLRKLAEQGHSADEISQMLLIKIAVVKKLMPKAEKPKAKAKNKA